MPNARCKVSHRPTFTCRDCKTSALGDTVTTEIEGEDLSSVIAQIAALEKVKKPAHMPVGWASVWATDRTQFLCRSCLEERK